MYRSITLQVSVAFVCLILFASCADVPTSTSDNKPQIKLTPNERTWVAFLECHSKNECWAYLAGSLPNITLTQTEQDKTVSLDGSRFYTSDPIPRNEAEGVVLSSGDQDLIKLHEKLKAAEKANFNSPEFLRSLHASSASETADRAFTAPNEYHGPTTEELFARPHSDYSAMHAAGEEASRAQESQQIHQAQLDLAKLKDPTVKKIKAENENAARALQKLQERHAVPSSELVAIMRRYVPSGSKGWNRNPGNGGSQTFFYGFHECASLSYGTWTY